MEELLFPYEFKIGDKVLAYHDGLLYQAIIKNRKISDYAEIEYYIHYKGFKRKWDEWSNSGDVLAVNEINLAHKERLEFNRKSCREPRKQRKNKNNSSPKSANKRRSRPNINVEQSAGSASARLKILTVEKSAKSDIQTFSKPANRKRGRQNINVEQSAGSASARLKKPTVEKSAKSDIQTFPKPAPKRSKKPQEPQKTNNAFSPKPANRDQDRPKKDIEQSAGLASIEWKQLFVRLSDVLKGPNPYTTQFTEQSTQLNVENSAELNSNITSEPAVTQKRKKISKEPRKTDNASSPKPKKIKPELGSPKINGEQSSGQASATFVELARVQLVEPDVDISAEPFLLTFERFSTVIFSLQESEKNNADLTEEESNVSVFAKQDSAQNASSLKPAKKKQRNAKKSMEQFAGPASSKLEEPIKSQYTEPAMAQLAGQISAQLAEPTTSQFVELAVEKSDESALQTFKVSTKTQPEGPFSIQIPEIVVDDTDILKCTVPYFALNTELAVRSNQDNKSQEPWTTEDASSLKPAKKKQSNPNKNVEQFAGPASSKLEEPTKSQYTESAIAQYVESLIAQCVEPATAQLAEPTTSQIVELAVEISDESALHTFKDAATTQLAGPSSTPFPELLVEDADFLKCTDQNIALITEPAAAQLTEHAIDKSADLNLQTFDELSTTQLAGPSSKQFPEEIVNDTVYLDCELPDIALNTELDVRSNRVKKSQEPWTTEDASSLKPAKKNRGNPNKNVEQFAGPASSKLDESTKSQYAESAIAQYVESLIAQCVEPATAQLAEPTTSQIVELAVEISDESALQTFKDTATTQPAGPSSTPFPELLVDDADFLKCTDQNIALITEPAAAQLTEHAIDKSADLNLRTFDVLSTTQLAGPSSKQFPEEIVNDTVYLNCELPDIALNTELDVRSNRVKKSQEPWTTEDASSLKPAKKKRGSSPKKNVEQSAGPASSKLEEPTKSQCVEPAVEKSAESTIQLVSEPASAQLAGPVSVQVAEPTTLQFVELAAEDAATSVVGESTPIVENEEAVRAVENIVINILPVAKPFAIELFKKLELPPVLKKALEFDRMMHHTYRKVLKFPDDNFVANIIYFFVNSSYFIDDDQKESSKMFSLTLLQYFNNCVNRRLIYMPERALRLPKKGMDYFRKRMENRPNIHYVYKNQINPKTIWCYLYGPMYLVRLIDDLPNILLSNLWYPDYGIEPFVDHIKELSRFLADNFYTYFTNDDYMDLENSV